MKTLPADTPESTHTFEISVVDLNTGYVVISPARRTYTIESEQGAAALESTRYLIMRAEKFYHAELERLADVDRDFKNMLKRYDWIVKVNLLS